MVGTQLRALRAALYSTGRRLWPLWACASLLASIGCTPKVEIGIPDDPIVINVNVRIEQEVRVRLEDDVAQLLAQESVQTRGAGEGSDDRLREAKARGLIGERFDGLLGDVTAYDDPELARLRRDYNASRTRAYAEVATRNAAPSPAVHAIAGQRRIERSGPGEFVMGPDRTWTKR